MTVQHGLTCFCTIFLLRKCKTFAFNCIGKIEFVTNLLGGEIQGQEQRNQWAPQICGRMVCRPRAQALAQRAASSLILATRVLADGRASLKTHSLRCFQIIQGMSKGRRRETLRATSPPKEPLKARWGVGHTGVPKALVWPKLSDTAKRASNFVG